MNNNTELKEYVEEHRVKGANVVYSSKGIPESGSYTTSKAAEAASNLYLGTHRFKATENGVTEIWFFGRHILVDKE